MSNTVCITDRVESTLPDSLKTLPDCHNITNVLPGPYNMDPFWLLGGMVAFVIVAILMGVIYVARQGTKQNINTKLVNAGVPGIDNRLTKAEKQLLTFERLDVDKRLRTIETYAGVITK